MLRPADAKGLVVGETFNPWLKSGQVRRVGTRGGNRKGKELEELECSRIGGMHVSVSLGVALLACCVKGELSENRHIYVAYIISQ